MTFFSRLTQAFSSSISREEPAPAPEEKKVVAVPNSPEMSIAADSYEAPDVSIVETVEEEPEPEELPLIEVPNDYNQDDLLRILVTNKGSDLHLSVGEVPRFRITGDLHL